MSTDRIPLPDGVSHVVISPTPFAPPAHVPLSTTPHEPAPAHVVPQVTVRPSIDTPIVTPSLPPDPAAHGVRFTRP